MRAMPLILGTFATIVACRVATADDDAPRVSADELARQLQRDVDPDVLSKEDRQKSARRWQDEGSRRRRAANERSTAEWRKIHSRADWEAFRRAKLDALRSAVGTFPPRPEKIKTVVTGTLAGDGYTIENVVYETRPGMWSTANLYLPAAKLEAMPPASMPGILICHAHHTGKTHGELQDMGMTWARLGAAVLVADQLGHGERRQHPFASARDYPKPFPVGRQDYNFRYDAGIQLHLIGDSLIGWMAWDLSRGVDVLLAQPGIDPQRIILMGAVAGGGDPAAVAAALDERIAAAVVFNFGGPQPETRFPLPDDAETWFNYAGGGSWESTRNISRSAADGFLPWAIVGGIAPRRLVYAHEFSWDWQRDPVWRRLETIWGFYDAPRNLAFAHGAGRLQGQPPEATHCTHVGPPHRKLIYPALKAWFDMPGSSEQEYSKRRPTEELIAMTAKARDEIKPRMPYEAAADVGSERTSAARQRRSQLSADERRLRLRAEWTKVLGDVASNKGLVVHSMGTHRPRLLGAASLLRVTLTSDDGARLPMLLLTPRNKADGRRPVVVAIAQAGKRGFFQRRSREIAELLNGGVAVCLPDLSGVGETRPDDGRDQRSSATSLSSDELMLGQTTIGRRLRDLRGILSYLRTRDDIDPKRIALWGDSLAEPNPADLDLKVPRGIDDRPRQSEPLGGLMALLGGLFEDDVAAVYVHGGLVGYADVLAGPFVYIPHDVVVPGVLTTGDLCDVAAALAPRPLMLDALVDGQNRKMTVDAASRANRVASSAYDEASAKSKLSIENGRAPRMDWLIAALKSRPN